MTAPDAPDAPVPEGSVGGNDPFSAEPTRDATCW